MWRKYNSFDSRNIKTTLLRLSSARLISSSAALKVRTSWFWWWPSIKHMAHIKFMSLEQKYSKGRWWIEQSVILSSFRGSTTVCVLNDSFSWCLWKCLAHSDTSHFRQVLSATDCSSMQWSQETVFSDSVSGCLSSCDAVARKPSMMLQSLKFRCRESTPWNSSRHSGQRGSVFSFLLAVSTVIQMQARQ